MCNMLSQADTSQEYEDITAEEEMGLAGATADDAEAEMIRSVTEKEILSSMFTLYSG